MLGRTAPPPDVTLRYGQDRDHVIDAWFAARTAAAAATADADAVADRPLLALVHGGFWRPEYDRLHLAPMAAALRDAGWDVASIEYRRRPGDPDVTVADVGAALVALPALFAEADPERRSRSEVGMIVVGHSAGGHLALLAAAEPPAVIVGVVALAPVADLRLAHELDLDGGAVVDFLGVAPDQRGDLDPACMASPAVPITVVHGTADTRVPLGVSESYAAAHPGTRLVRVQGADHFALIDPLSRAWPVVAGELMQLATPGSVRSARPDRCSPPPRSV